MNEDSMKCESPHLLKQKCSFETPHKLGICKLSHWPNSLHYLAYYWSVFYLIPLNSFLTLQAPSLQLLSMSPAKSLSNNPSTFTLKLVVANLNSNRSDFFQSVLPIYTNSKHLECKTKILTISTIFHYPQHHQHAHTYYLLQINYLHCISYVYLKTCYRKYRKVLSNSKE